MELKGFYAENSISTKAIKDGTNYGPTHRATFRTIAGNLVTDIRDKNNNQLTNPLPSNADGYFECKISNGTYLVTIEGGGAFYTQPITFNDMSSKVPLLTDGRSLSRLKAKLANIATGKVKICLAGDSYHEYTPLPQYFASKLYAKYTKASEGFISVGSTGAAAPMNGVLFVRNGWSSQDISSGSAPTLGTGLDGQSAFTTTTTATMSISNVTCTNIDIYFINRGGSFEYRVDAGSWIEVVGSNDGSFGYVSITGLTNDVHTLDIRTTTNTGTVVLTGFRCFNPSLAGVEVLKVGNSGSTGPQSALYAPYVGDTLELIEPDALIINLGGNDISTALSNPILFVQGVKSLVDAYKAVVPDISVILSFPPKINRTIVNDQQVMRDALYNFAIESGYEFNNTYDAFGEWVDMNDYGLFTDTIHPNILGAAVYYDRILREYF